jgi:hypothetical protein
MNFGAGTYGPGFVAGVCRRYAAGFGDGCASLGASHGFDPDLLRIGGAVILAIFGIVLLIPPLQAVMLSLGVRYRRTG